MLVDTETKHQVPFLERTNLDCSEVGELLDCYVDNEMISPLRARFDVHLENCQCCRNLVQDCKHIVDIAKTLNDAPIPSDVSLRLRRALRDQVGYNVISLKPRLSVVKT